MPHPFADILHIVKHSSESRVMPTELLILICPFLCCLHQRKKKTLSHLFHTFREVALLVVFVMVTVWPWNWLFKSMIIVIYLHEGWGWGVWNYHTFSSLLTLLGTATYTDPLMLSAFPQYSRDTVERKDSVGGGCHIHDYSTLYMPFLLRQCFMWGFIPFFHRNWKQPLQRVKGRIKHGSFIFISFGFCVTASRGYLQFNVKLKCAWTI